MTLGHPSSVIPIVPLLKPSSMSSTFSADPESPKSSELDVCVNDSRT